MMYFPSQHACLMIMVVAMTCFNAASSTLAPTLSPTLSPTDDGVQKAILSAGAILGIVTTSVMVALTLGVVGHTLIKRMNKRMRDRNSYKPPKKQRSPQNQQYSNYARHQEVGTKELYSPLSNVAVDETKSSV